MSTRLSVLDPGDMESRARLLSRHEQELLARILQHAETLSAESAELLPLVQAAIVRAVGELLLLRSAEETAAEIVQTLKKQGPHPPKAEPFQPLRDDGPHPPKPPGPGEVEPLPGRILRNLRVPERSCLSLARIHQSRRGPERRGRSLGHIHRSRPDPGKCSRRRSRSSPNPLRRHRDRRREVHIRQSHRGRERHRCARALLSFLHRLAQGGCERWRLPRKSF
jgi:hypothetical protein